MIDEGYIKFNCIWTQKIIKVSDALFLEINNWRSKLYDLDLIGMYDNGIGFGNISIRDSKNSFIISGSATGGKSELTKDDYSRVTNCNYKENRVDCVGQSKASSESLSHSIVYETLDNINAVIHIHSPGMWKKYLNVLPTTSKDILYGTPEMAKAIQQLIGLDSASESGAIVMGGHEEGLLFYGEHIDATGNYLLEIYHQFLNTSEIS